jgi:hypothetical protein
MPTLEIHHYTILLVAGLLAGFVDSIAGGGGIITVPAFLAVGFPPHLALGTNKLQASFGSCTATTNYARKGLVNLREVKLGVIFTAIGAATGTLVIQMMSTEVLKHVIVVGLAAIFVYMLFSRNVGKESKPHRIPHGAFYVCFGLLLGFYDGFFGPGVGSFWTLAFIVLLGLDMKRATGHTKSMNFTSNIVSLAFFLRGGNVVISAGLLMAVGQMAGAYAGSHLVIKKGVNFVRILFMAVVAVTLAHLAYKTYFS